MLTLLAFVFFVFAEEAPLATADIHALQTTIPNLVAEKAIVEDELNSAQTYRESGDFRRSFPNFADKPMLSPPFLLSVLTDLQTTEIELSMHKDSEQCLECSQQIHLEITEHEAEIDGLKFKLIDTQRRLVLKLYAQLLENPLLQHQNIMVHGLWWQDHFSLLESELEDYEDHQDTAFLNLQQELQITGQQIGHLNAIQQQAVEKLTSEESRDLEDWFVTEISNYSESEVLLEQRAAYEITQIYSSLLNEDSPHGSLTEVISARYHDSVSTIVSGYETDLAALELLPLSNKAEGLVTIKAKYEQQIQRYHWLSPDLGSILDQITVQMSETSSAIEQEARLSQQEHQEEVLRAEKDLEEARVMQQQEQEQIEALIQDEVVRIRELIQQQRTDDQEFRSWVNGRVDAYNSIIIERETVIQDAIEQSLLSRDRQEKIDRIYLQADADLEQVRKDLQKVQDQSIDVPPVIEFNTSEIDSVRYEDSLESLEQAQQDLFQALQDRSLSRKEEELSLFKCLESLKLLRRDITPLASDEALFSGRVDFWAELKSEFLELPVHTVFLGLDLYNRVLRVPTQLARFDVLSRILSGAFFLALIGITWFTLRRYSSAIVRKTIGYFQGLGWNWNQPLTLPKEQYWDSPFAVDTLFLLALYFGWHESHPLMALMTLLALGSFLRRWNQYLNQQKQTFEKRFFQTLFYIIVYVYTYLFTHELAIVIMSADRISELFSFVFWVGGLPFSLWILFDWSEIAEEKTAKWVEEHRFVHWLTLHLSSRFIRKIIWSLVGIYMLIFQAFVFSSLLLIEGTGWFGKSLTNSVEVYLQNNASMNKAERVFADLERLYQINDELEALNASLAEWSKTKNNGVIAIIGDRGTGKTTLLNQTQYSNHERVFISPHKRIRNAEMLRAWLAEAFGCPDSENIEQAMLNRPSQLIIVDRINFLFLRSMHGYDGLYELSRIMQKTAHHHCWIVSIHLHTWNFLNSNAIPFKTDVFYSAIEISMINVQKCLAWSHHCAEEHNVRVDFSKLNNRYKSDYFLRQAEKSYWRLLVDTSIQNPSTIRRLWLNSLEYSDSENAFFVHFFESPSQADLDSLSMTEQFILASILIHGDLTAKEQSESLNIDLAEINHCCNSLENQGILLAEQGLYKISYRWYPSVILFLQHKHMLVAS